MIAAPVIGHRGAASLAPENTLAGIRKAAATGVTWVELDATLLGDHTAVLSHDDSLERCSNRHGQLSSLSSLDLGSIDVGSWFHLDWQQETLPRLADALLQCQSLGLGLNLEIKPFQWPAQTIAEVLHETISVYWQDKSRLIISCFDLEVLAAYRALDKHIQLGLLFDDIPPLWQLQAQNLNAVSIHCNWQLLMEKEARQIKQAGYDLYCFTCNSPADAARLYSWGVDGVFTDTPQDFLNPAADTTSEYLISLTSPDPL
ncbi:glycerophosphodiester phosphodiesterase family protein [Pontibacter sp. JAM-7]|uniref:glycerophosphodiester phosphodiesterase family protein n=1 Tax=Pontibacter sp. JAM-7 TaxID=3366581 RepID=UPI003AF46826